MRLSTVILPIHRWAEGQAVWRRAEDLNFHTAYTYDHLSWRTFRDGPWFGALPTLTAAATVTERLRLGTLVTSPNFRHPVTLAKDLMTLLREHAVSYAGDFYSASEVRNIPGCVQRPRLPFAVAATGPRGLKLAARYGQAWVTTGDPKLFGTGTQEQSLQAVHGQVERLDAACAEFGRDARELGRIMLTGFTPEPNQPLQSLDAFVDFAGKHKDAGITEIVIHWPIPDSDFAVDHDAFERIATEAAAQLK
jgi:alkanesulfonate monooxygenase SsuD/methylene tetrahydromethanopterin reductase-like flavin-dependent oxidoreductase (luciferase family)